MTFIGSFRDTFYNAIAQFTEVYTSALTNATGTVIPANALAGGQLTVVSFSGQGAVSLTLDTSQNLIYRMQNAVLQQLAQQGIIGVNAGNVGELGRNPNPGIEIWVNVSYILRVINNNSGVLTLVPAAANESIVGTATVAAGGFRDYAVTVGGRSGPFTFTSIGSGTA